MSRPRPGTRAPALRALEHTSDQGARTSGVMRRSACFLFVLGGRRRSLLSAGHGTPGRLAEPENANNRPTDHQLW